MIFIDEHLPGDCLTIYSGGHQMYTSLLIREPVSGTTADEPTSHGVEAYNRTFLAMDVQGAIDFGHQKSKTLQDSLSHQILRYMYGVLNIKKIKTNYTVCL